ncbi:MAG: DMT family transporter, partial [Candidatus Buchananbacteria bacterium]
ASLVLKEKLPKKFFFWATVAIIATYFVTFENLVPNFNTGEKTIFAALFSLGAAFAFGSSTVFSKRALQKVSYKMGTYLRFGLTTVLMFFIAASFGNLSAISQITPKQFLIFLLIVFTSGAASMFLYYYGLKKVTASVSTICELAFPLSAILFEFLLRSHWLSWSQWLGVVVLFIAIYQVSVKTQKIEIEKTA